MKIQIQILSPRIIYYEMVNKENIIIMIHFKNNEQENAMRMCNNRTVL